MLITVLSYSTPVWSLHSCNTLNHFHEETCIEESHPHCYLCDMQFHPFVQDLETFETCITSVTSDFICFYKNSHSYHFIEFALNKGPPKLS